MSALMMSTIYYGGPLKSRGSYHTMWQSHMTQAHLFDAICKKLGYVSKNYVKRGEEEVEVEDSYLEDITEEEPAVEHPTWCVGSWKKPLSQTFGHLKIFLAVCHREQ